MRKSIATNSPGSTDSAPQGTVLSPWQRLKSQRICYLTLPLLIMATVTEFVILATGWKYQQMVCLPQGMGVIFFGIGPIGATILAVELLKLPLAIWTASRQGWQKGMMLIIGLPLICLLTFQLVKDMAVYEMGIALAPASRMLKEATKEEVKITQLNGELVAIEAKKADRDRKLAELAGRKAKAKAELEESLKRNEDARQDAISLTDYQKKELSAVEGRQATIIKQVDADVEQLTKAIADLRARRETELGRATRWNAEEARIDNAYKARMADYANKKSAYEKEKMEYDNANFFRRQLMKEPVDPGVPPERESNTILKPTLVAEIDSQIKAKEAELFAVNSQRRDRVAQVDDNAHRLREEFDHRSSSKREETDRKREELLAGQAALASECAEEEKQIDQEFEAASRKVDGIRAELDDCRKRAEGFYEAREAAIENTQVHRIATTVEIVRGLLTGQRPVSIKATARERGDLYTDQISMVRIWVYPVLAFIVAFLPTLMVEIGFSTIFQTERQRPPYRLGFLGCRLHWLYTRAGRQKILRAERLACEASGEIAARDKALAEATAAAEKALDEKETELQVAREAMSAAAFGHKEQLKQKEQEYSEQLKNETEQWVGKLAGVTESLNRTIVEKDALRDLQKSEIERQIQMRQNAWSGRLTQMRQELDEQRAAGEAERMALTQAQHQKLLEMSEDCKKQIIQARRQAADAELAAVDASAKLTQDLKEALRARDAAESQLQQQADSFSLKLSQAKEDAAREMEKAMRQEKHRLERQQLEFGKALRQSQEDFEHQLKQREQELTLGFDARLVEQEARIAQEARRREAELERQMESRALKVDARWKQEAQQREEAAQTRLKQREQQLQTLADAHLGEMQTQAEQALRRRESELERQLQARAHEADIYLKQELQQQELAFQAKLKQREQELSLEFDTRLVEQGTRLEQDARRRETELERQIEARALELDARWKQESQQREQAAQIRLQQREQQLQAQAEARVSELQTQVEQELRRRESESERRLEAQAREADTRLKQELQQQELAFQAKLKQRDQELATKAGARETELRNQWASDLRVREEQWELQADARVRATETRLGLEAQQKEEAAQAEARQREQILAAQLSAQAEARQTAARAQWEKESEKKTRAALEPFKTLLVRAETERDEARETAADSVSQVQHLEKKLTEASSFLNGWRNGKNLVVAE
jgi:hypothetical protein